ncbi:MAG: inositol monophosphatase family protein [Rhodobacterales bacterium]
MPRFTADTLPDLQQTRALMHGLMTLIEDNIPRIQATRYDITLKPDNSPVTASDVFIEHLICDYLKAQIPDITFAGEETFTAETDLTSEGYYAILDPIDGTENFCSGLKEWGVSFTLWHGKTHLGSLLYLPELREHLMTGDTLVPVHSRIRGFSSSMCDEILQGMQETQESRLVVSRSW